MSPHNRGFPSLVDVHYRQAGVWPWECFINDNGGNGSFDGDQGLSGFLFFKQ
jgi:hypothetical protein